MPQLLLDIPHTLTQDEAANRLKKKLEFARAQFQAQLTDFREEWCDHAFSFGFKALGMAVSGKVTIEPSNVKLDAQLPMAAAFFKKTIEDRVRQEVGKLLS